jgi:hypothetical protein
MNTRRRALLVAAVLGASALVSACDAVKEGVKAISPTTSTIAGAPPATGGGTPNANAVACLTERNNVQLAVDSYTLLEGAPPAAEAQLVPDYLRVESELFDIAPDGTVIPAPGAGC